MDLSEFDFHIPKHLVAQEPVEPRDSARLLVYNRATNAISHHHVRDLPTILPKNTHIVVNDSKVRHARLHTDTGREVLILSHINGTAECLTKGKHPSPNSSIQFPTKNGDVVSATVLSGGTHQAMNTLLLQFKSDQEIHELCAEDGSIPLPPYISNPGLDTNRYQTVYSNQIGSAAAPTAGLHFTHELIDQLKKDHTWDTVTLHVGLGTFLPLKKSQIEENSLHSEATFIAPETAQILEGYRAAQESILAVGTTSMRTLESHYENGRITPNWITTDLFLYPGKQIHVPNMMFTNFHTPKSSLLVLVTTFLMHNSAREIAYSKESALATLKHLYQTAISEEYRFYSLGDAMLIL